MPVAIGQVGHVMFGVVDSLMVGSIGKNPLAAASLVNGIVILILILGLGMSLAATPLIGIAKGKKNNDLYIRIPVTVWLRNNAMNKPPGMARR